MGASKDEIYMQHRAFGLSQVKSAELSGVTLAYGMALEKSPKGVLLLQKFQSLASEELEHTRSTVLKGLKAAYDIACQQRDPVAMVTAVREIAKVIGAYAPERKEVQVHVHGAVALAQVRQMSDFELMRLAEAGGRILEHRDDGDGSKAPPQ